MHTPLIAVATSNRLVQETIRGAVSAYYQQKGKGDAVQIATVPADYVLKDGFVATIEAARLRAATAREKHGALIGVAGARGNVSLRRDSRTIALWTTFAVAAVSAQSLVACSLASNTYPEAMTPGINKIMENLLVGYAVGKPEPSEEDTELADVAITSWAEMYFEEPYLNLLWAQ